MRAINLARRVAASALVFSILLLGQPLVGAQTAGAGARRQSPAGAGQTPAPPAGVSGGSRADGGAATLSSSARGQEMASAFETGRLPDPLRRPPGDADEVAAALARQVSARDGQSTAALLAALLAAGFGLRDADGGVTQTVTPGQGLVFDAWEVAAMAKMYGERRDVQLAYLSDGLKAIPELKQTPLDSLLLEGIRTHARGDQPLLRFFARFIVELGRNAPEPYDLLAASDPKAVRLDAVQAALLLRRLYGDLHALAQRGEQAARASVRPSPRFVRAAWSGPPPAPGRARATAAPPQGGQPCAGVGSDPVHDAMATGLTSFWGGLFGNTRLGKGVGIANIVLAYAKMVATYAALETEITVENPPLVRTKNAVPGQRRQLTAKVTMNLGGHQQFNCFRHMLNFFTGLDFSLLDDGPVEGVEVNWHVDQPGDFYSNSAGVTGNRPVAGITSGGPRIQDAGTYAGIPGRAGVPVGNATRSKTDKNGDARTFLEGAPKVPYVSEPSRTVTKHVTVRTTVKLKGGDIKGDAVDLAGQLTGGLGGLLTMPAELLYRTDWASTGSLVVPVRDHEPCEGEWYGTITYTETFKDERSFQEPNQTGRWSRGETYEASVEVTGREPTPHRVILLNARLKANAGRSETRYGRGTSKTLCNLENNMTSESSGKMEQSLQLGVMLTPDGRYSVHYTLPSVSTAGQSTKSRKVLECKNPFIKPGPETTTPISGSVSPSAPDIEGTIDPGNPNELKGGKTVTLPEQNGTRTGVLTWNLVRCAR